MNSSTLTTKRFLPDAAADIRSHVRIIYSDKIDRIEDCEPQEIDTDTLVLPPFCNAHDHGRGLRTIAYGASDTALEAWVPATLTLPKIDPYLIAASAFGRMVKSGIGSVIHCHLPRGGPEVMLREARAVKRAAEDVGIRVAFVVPLRDRNRLAYGSDAKLLSYLSAADVDAVQQLCLKPGPSIQQQIESVLEIAAECESAFFQVQFGPGSIERCSDALLREVAEVSGRTNRRVHMHVLETKYQREWIDVTYPGGAAQHLRAVGLLSPRLTIAHGTWTRRHECELFAENGVTISINTSSNLRLKSGIAPLRTIKEASMNFAIGLDALALDDDDDIIREMRLGYLLHRGHGFDEFFSSRDFITAATNGITRLASFNSDGGRIAVSSAADLLVIDFAGMTSDSIEGLYEPLDILLARGSATHVRMLVLNGRTVFNQGKVLGIDEPAINRELHAQFSRSAPMLRELRPLLLRFQAAQKRFCVDGCHILPENS
jgi:cytosine/adenosine deaminase-related metal-dependent hydrolase